MQIPGHIDPVVTPRAITPRSDGRLDLMGLSHLQIKQLFLESQLDDKAAKLRSKQVFHWIYHRGVTDFEMMTDIAKTMRPWLAQRFVIGRPEVIEAQVSSDGTRKWLLRTDDAQDYEMVFIPDADRGTLCISSQVGCTLNCRFCHTGTMRLVRNLTPGEIVGQVMLARDALGEWPKGNMAGFGEEDDEDDDTGHYTSDGRMLTNIVLMGMGEPLYNFDNVRDALKVVMHGDGLALSKRRITLSTSGVVPEIAHTATEIGCLLAVSFHATTDEVRDVLVPINKRWNIETLLAALKDYPNLSNSERITFEYVMLDGVNDTKEDAHRLVKLLEGIPAKVNLIPFNEWPGAPYKRSSGNRIHAFADIIYKAGYATPIRTPRGEDIMAACGQLKSATERSRKSKAQIEAETKAG